MIQNTVSTKTKLLIFALLVIIFKSISLAGAYRQISDISYDPRVLGTNLSKDISTGFLPDYPVLTDDTPTFASRQYTLFDVDSGIYLVNQDAITPVPLASTTKIMTTILAIEELDLDSVHTVNKESSFQIGSSVLLRPEERITVKSLLYAALLNSGNDSAYCLAHELGLHYSNNPSINYEDAIALTVSKMNEKAQQLGLQTLYFTDPSGLETSNVGSAHDMAMLASYAMNNDTFSTISGTAETTIYSTDGLVQHQLKNSNRLISDWHYPGALGVKTGFTPDAGHNLIAALNFNGHTLIAVVFNTFSDTKPASAEVARDILDYAKRSIEYH